MAETYPQYKYEDEEVGVGDREPAVASMAFVEFLTGHPELLADIREDHESVQVPFYKPMATEYTQDEIERAPRTPSAKLTQLYSRDMYREKDIADDTQPDPEEE